MARKLEQEIPARQVEQQGRGKLEWFVSVTSALLVLVVLAYLAWEGVQPREAASFRVTVGSVRVANGRYYLPVSVRNTGDHTVRDVTLRIELSRAGSSVAATDITLDWLPAHSVGRAVAVFSRDPRGYTVQTSIKGYSVP